MTVLVLGAGLAGLSCALELARRGFAVTVVEAAPFAGGRTSSWTAAGVARDTGLHVVADHYLNLLDLLEGVGIADRLTWWSQHSFLHPDRRPLTMRFDPYPAPFHLWYAARNISLPLGERMRLGAAALEMATFTQADLAGLDNLPYLEWHRRRGLGDGFLLELAEVAADAAAFLKPSEISTRAVLSWMKYLGRNTGAARLATWRGTLAEDLIEPLVNQLRRHGGQLLAGRAVVGLRDDGGRVSGVLTCASTEAGAFHRADGRPGTASDASTGLTPCDAVVSALPPQALRQALTELQLQRAGLQAVNRLRTVPAISATLYLDTRIPAPIGVPLVARCSIRDLIDVSPRFQSPQKSGALGSVLQFVVSRAVDPDTLDDDALIALLHRDLLRIWPAARGTRVASGTVERIGAALFAAIPGAHALRPTTTTGIPGLFLAGDWTRHDLNASMEGAVLSGRLAARAVAGARGSDIPVRTVHEPMVAQLMQGLARPLVSARLARPR